MTPYRASAAARFLQLSAALVLVGGGLIAVTGLSPDTALPPVFAVAIVGGLVGLGLGIDRHPAPTALLVITLPFALFAYFLVLQIVLAYAPTWGWLLAGWGLVHLAMAALHAPRAARRHASVESHA